MGSTVPTMFTTTGALGPATSAAILANPILAETTQEDATVAGIQDQYQSAASELTAQGDTEEAGLYGEAAGIANANALTALSAGDIKEAQTQLEVNSTIGSQRASVAGNGFQEAGSAVDLMRSSLQQGHLDEQLDVENADLQAGGFYEQASASQAEQTAATTAAGVASSTAAMASTLSGEESTIASKEAAAIKTVGGPGANNPLLAGTPGHYII